MQVRHIPMVVVVHADGRGWQFDANDEFHMELWGNHARIRPAGEMYATFHDGDEYCWAPVRAHRHPAAQTLAPAPPAWPPRMFRPPCTQLYARGGLSM